MILDVGCGTEKRGFPLKQNNVVHADVDRGAYHLEVLCDVHCLPFKAGSFGLVFASHIVEHLINPLEGIRNLKRVAQNIVIIKVPNASFHLWEESLNHLFSWNEHTLRNLLKKEFVHVKIEASWRRLHKSKGSLKDKIETLKWIVISLLMNKDELTAICHKKWGIT